MKDLNCFFVSDLHGSFARYNALFQKIEEERPHALFFGGDLMPNPVVTARGWEPAHEDFITLFLAEELHKLRERMGDAYPRIFLILGNDDAATEIEAIEKGEARGLWEHCHDRRFEWEGFSVFGYACIPPTPFVLKDWERYDAGPFVRPGCIAPEDGAFTLPHLKKETLTTTIARDLEKLTAHRDLSNGIFLFHSPPHRSNLDRAALDGRRIDDIQVDVHVGSVAIASFIQKKQPLITLHGHIHESSRLTHSWRDTFGGTHAFSAAVDCPQLALIRFSPFFPADAQRELI